MWRALQRTDRVPIVVNVGVLASQTKKGQLLAGLNYSHRKENSGTNRWNREAGLAADMLGCRCRRRRLLRTAVRWSDATVTKRRAGRPPNATNCHFRRMEYQKGGLAERENK
jgi:hypothetical protein